MHQHLPDPARRRLLRHAAWVPVLPALGALEGCAVTAPLSPISAAETTQPMATQLLTEAAAAHGLSSWRRVRDLNISYTGDWKPLIGRLQPELVDPQFRISAQERLLPSEGLIAQSFTGPGGTKQVLRRQTPANHGSTNTGSVQVWYKGQETTDEVIRHAAALVADSYRVFLLGPLALIERAYTLKLAGLEDVGDFACERLMVRLVPGLGYSPVEQLVLCIDRRTRLLRRVRYTMEGLASTRGMVAEVDLLDYQSMNGIEWPTRFQKRLRKPIPLLPVHEWTLTGLDINRGWSAYEISGAQFTGSAAAPAKALPGSATAG